MMELDLQQNELIKIKKDSEQPNGNIDQPNEDDHFVNKIKLKMI